MPILAVMLIADARQAADFLAPHLAQASGEVLVVAYLSGGNRLCGSETFQGGPDECLLPVRRIIGEALRLDAAGLVIAHNHPSGDPSPSRADLAATRALADAARAVDLRLHDHLILAGGKWQSLRALGLL